MIQAQKSAIIYIQSDYQLSKHGNTNLVAAVTTVQDNMSVYEYRLVIAIQHASSEPQDYEASRASSCTFTSNASCRSVVFVRNKNTLST